MKWDIGSFVIGILLATSASASGQDMSHLCRRIDDSIESLKPEKVDRRDVYRNQCVVEVTLANDIDVYLSLQRFGSEKQSKLEFANTLSLFSYDENMNEVALQVEKVNAPGVWDQAISYKEPRVGVSSFVLLQKGGFFITLMSNRYSVLSDWEKALRSVKLD
jgi:hypothetical protein